MRIGITTFHFAENCGAMLQCYALQEKLRSMGADTVIIDYRPQYHEKRYSVFGTPLENARASYRKYRPLGAFTASRRALRAFLGTIKAHKNAIKSLKLKFRFKKFMKANLILTKKYKMPEELRRNPPKCDVYVSGSDQLWNPGITGGKPDLVYYLDFAPRGAKRITYAVSACELGEIPPEAAEAIKKLDCISLRETEMRDKVEAVCGKKAHISIDPVFLLPPDRYSGIIREPAVSEPYILVYAIPDSGISNFCGAVNKIGEKYKALYIDISPERLAIRGRTRHLSAAPDEFLGYIRKADLVITNSFHATAFSLLFNKRFVAVPNKSRSSRITELLGRLGLQDRVVSEPEDAAVVAGEDIDYSGANGLMEDMKRESEDYLRYSIYKDRDRLYAD